jgi:hypothetical protein
MFEIRNCDVSSFVLLAQKYFGYLEGGGLCFHMNFGTFFSSSVKNVIFFFFDEDCIESVISTGCMHVWKEHTELHS